MAITSSSERASSRVSDGQAGNQVYAHLADTGGAETAMSSSTISRVCSADRRAIPGQQTTATPRLTRFTPQRSRVAIISGCQRPGRTRL